MALPSNPRSTIVEATIVDHVPPENAWVFAGKYCWLAGLLMVVTIGWQLYFFVGLFGTRLSLNLASLAVLGLLVVSPLVWLVAFCLFPRPTQCVTLFGLLGFMVLAPLPCLVQQSRETARRNICTSNLRQLGIAVSHYELMHEPISNWPANAAQEPYLWTDAVAAKRLNYLDSGWQHEP